MHHHPRVRSVHRASAALLGAFVLLHFANHLVALRGIDAHQAFLTAARTVYRAPFVEPLLLAAVLVQGATGVLQLRAGWGMRRGFWSRLFGRGRNDNREAEEDRRERERQREQERERDRERRERERERRR